MNELEIHKYKIEGDERYHNVPKHFTTDFEEAVSSLDGKCEHLEKMTYRPTEEDYKTRSEDTEYKNRTGDIENFYHPLEGLDYKAIEAVFETVLIQKYKISVPSDARSIEWITHCLADFAGKFEQTLEDYGAEYQKLDKYPITKKQYQDFCNNHPTNETPLPLDVYDKLAIEFQQELNKRNINKEDLSMNSTTSEQQTVNLEFTLEQQLKALNDEQYLTLYSFYGQGCINEYNELIKDCQDLDEVKLDIVEALAERINNDEEEHKPKLLELLQKYHFDYYGKDAHLDSLKTEVKETKKDLKDIVNGFNKKLSKLVPEDKLVLLKQEKEERKFNRAKLRRQKRIERGLDGHLMAVACAVIDGGEEGGQQYIEKANKQADEVLNKAVAVVNEMDNDNRQPDPKSEKGMKKVFKAVLPKKDKSKAK